MSIPGKQTINVGLPNESTGSDSLYTAFNKAEYNFDTLFACASPYNTFTPGGGIGIASTAGNGTVVITNAGVTNIIAGTNIVVSSANGNVTISTTGGGSGGGGTVTSVALVPSSRLVVTGSPVVSSATINIDLATSGVVTGTYINPTMTVDVYGRVTSAVNGSVSGTVTSVGLTPGPGIQINGGPVTSSGNITVTNIGVTRVNAGAGISLSSGNGNVTISTTSVGGTVTSIGVSSSQLVVSNSPVVSAGTIAINLPASATFAGTVTASTLESTTTISAAGSENLLTGSAVSLAVTASYFTTLGPSTATLAAGTAGLIKTFMLVADGGDMVITVTNPGWKGSGTGTITFNDTGDGCTLQYINSKWYCIGNNGVVFA